MSAPVIRFAILIAAILVIPWLASNPPRWGGWDSGWVQAFGSIAAILVGFCYVGLQNFWQREERKTQQAEARQHVLNTAATVNEEAGIRMKLFGALAPGPHTIVRSPASDSMDVLGDQLLAVSTTECGSATFASLAKSIGLFAKSLAAHCKEIADAQTIDADQRERLRQRVVAIEDAYAEIEQVKV